MDGKVIESSNLQIDLGNERLPSMRSRSLSREGMNLGAKATCFSAPRGVQHVLVQMRHLGIVRPLSVLPAEHGRRCLAHVKAKGARWTSPRAAADRRTAAGSSTDGAPNDPGVDLRIVAIPTLHGEDLAITLGPAQPATPGS